MKIIGIIERNDNDYYQIFSEDEIMGHCFGGYGYTMSEAKADFMESIKEAKEMIVEDGLAIPADATNIDVEFRFAKAMGAELNTATL